MKKLIAILTIMTILVCAVFAVSDELVVKATVDKVAPVFKIYGSTSNPVASTIYGTNPLDESKSTVESSANPSSESVVVYVRFAQYGSAKYKNTALTVTITPTPLYLNGEVTNDDTMSSALPTVVSSNTDAQATIKGTTTTTADAITGLVPTISSSVATYTLNYTGIAVGSAEADTDIDTLTMTWGAKDALIPGVYKAYITLGYTTD